MHLADRGFLDPLHAAGDAASVATSDDTLAGAMIDVEVAWLGVLADAGLAQPGDDELARQLLRDGLRDAVLDTIGQATALGGNAVIPLVAALRERLAEARTTLPDAIHRGLTSQDVLDTALQLVAARLIDRVVRPALVRAGDAAARLARDTRTDLALARTLAQPALPTTIGAKAAAWLEGIADALAALDAARAALAVQLGGAAGTMASTDIALHARASEATGASLTTVATMRAALAARLGLADPRRPWHTTRQPVLALASALAGVVAAAGTIAADTVTLSRAEIAELAEGAEAGAGGSSAMPQKRNPVHGVVLRAAALQAPSALATVYAAAGAFVDERPDGAWHAEWPSLRILERLAGGAARHLAALLEGLRVDRARARANLDAAGEGVLSERLVARFGALAGRAPLRDALRAAALGGGSVRAAVLALLPDEVEGRPSADVVDETLDPAGYVGEAPALVDLAVERWGAVSPAPGGDSAAAPHAAAPSAADSPPASDSPASATDAQGPHA